MPLFRRPPPAESDAPTAESLLPPEEIADRRRRVRRLAGVPLGLILLVGLYFGGREGLHRVKAWQAHRAAAEAEHLIGQEKWLEARAKVQDAVTIWPSEPEGVRAGALLFTRTNNHRLAVSYWQQLEAMRPLAAGDQRELATSLLALGGLDDAETRARRAWPAGQPGTPADWSLAMQLAVRRNRGPEAFELARRLLAAAESPGKLRLNAALLLLLSTNGADQAAARQAVSALAQGGQSAESLDALFVLAQLAANAAALGAAPPAPTAGVPAPPPLAELIARIEKHPLARIQHQLRALDLRASLEPARRAAFIQQAVDRFAKGDDAELQTLGAWLYGKGEYARELEVLPLARAVGDRALFLQHLDALGALDRWDEIRALVQAQKFPLDPLTQQMYLARCADQTGATASRDAYWDGALEAAGRDPAKLLLLARYAEKSGGAADRTAEAAFRAAARAAPDQREPQEALVRFLETRGRTRDLRAALLAMAALWPQDASIRNDAAYLGALLGDDVPAALATARELARAQPGSLPHRVTLALCELRLGHALAAMDAFANVPAPGAGALPRQRAVYAAALWATSYEREAREQLSQLPLDRLLAEERALVQPIIDADKPKPPS